MKESAFSLGHPFQQHVTTEFDMHTAVQCVTPIYVPLLHTDSTWLSMIIPRQCSPVSGRRLPPWHWLWTTTCFDHWDMMQPTPEKALADTTWDNQPFFFPPVNQQIPKLCLTRWWRHGEPYKAVAATVHFHSLVLLWDSDKCPPDIEWGCLLHQKWVNMENHSPALSPNAREDVRDKT